jgi:hypothetical protein
MGPNKQMQQQQLVLTNLKRGERKKNQERERNTDRERERKDRKKVNKQQETEQMIDLLRNASDSSIAQPLFIKIPPENFYFPTNSFIKIFLHFLVNNIINKICKICRISINFQKTNDR